MTRWYRLNRACKLPCWIHPHSGAQTRTLDLLQCTIGALIQLVRGTTFTFHEPFTLQTCYSQAELKLLSDERMPLRDLVTQLKVANTHKDTALAEAKVDAEIKLREFRCGLGPQPEDEQPNHAPAVPKPKPKAAPR